MLSLCGCSSRRRGKKASSVSSDDVAPKVTAGKGPPDTINHSAIIPPGPSRLSLDDFGVQTLELPKRKSSNALEAVKAKLIRHWSYNKDQPQKSRASPDGDKDEIARRAELRRFRARRIQEELNQDHSKCVSTHTSIRSTRYLSPLIDIGRHDNDSILKNFGAFAEDGSSYATADDGEADSKKSPPRTRHDSVKQDHNGQAGQTNTSNRHLPSTLSIEKRRENSEPDITASGSKLPAPNWNSRIRAERTGLPTIWRSGHASWDIQASLPKRISSKFWSQSRTASATIPETNTPGSVCNEGSTDNQVEIAADRISNIGKYRRNSRATLQKSKAGSDSGKHQAYYARQANHNQ
ncbi:hypothetical protein NHJ6243_003398 [Beauveria neobassiana]